jgi:deoxyinosine 3'endonuclease (endonuclease V)
MHLSQLCVHATEPRRGMGVASHLGVLEDIPTIGVAKTLLAVDELDERTVVRAARERLSEGGMNVRLLFVRSFVRSFVLSWSLVALRLRFYATHTPGLSGEFLDLVGSSGRLWGRAQLSTSENIKPVFVSPGHRITVETASLLVHR